jgi:hypothetical protein
MGQAMLEAKKMAESFSKGEIRTAAGTSDEMAEATKAADVPF